MKKLISTVTAVVITAAMLTSCSTAGSTSTTTASTKEQAVSENSIQSSAESSETETETDESASSSTNRQDFSGVSIEMLNTKSEIQSQLEDAAKQWSELTGATLEVYTIGSGSPSQEISARYAANNAPALIMGDIQDIVDVSSENAVDLSDQSWAENGGTKYGYSADGKLYSFPFCIEARGLMYNKTVIEETLGESWDPSSITNLDDFKALLDKLVAAGMTSPVALNAEDWSNAGHYFTLVYEEQDGTLEGAESFINGLKDGSQTLSENARFNSLMDTYDVLMAYNINKDDPLAADYDENAADLAEGEIAFWFNGNWAWAEISDYIEDDTQLGIMPVVQNDTEGNANVNSYLAGSASKHIMVDKTCNDEQQQAAAKDFLDWLVNTPEGVKVMVEDCSLVPPFSNITEEANNDLGISVQQYSNAGQLFPGVTDYPGDHWSTVGAIMQKYLGGQIDRTEFANEVQAYWETQE
ncbi:MAG: ABC transporter substrate-binding protein [Oscillospiraceae bacterium]|nr:ABC transporter substrate-binding protein [Oscillospiraceae bacterium]MDD4368884.1 ABC transporter substrate-binding protein [Oscillospiraceae bacterium]